MLQRVLIGLVLYQLDIDYHEFIPEILSILREIMIDIGDTSLKPTVDFIEAKYTYTGKKIKKKPCNTMKKLSMGQNFLMI